MFDHFRAVIFDSDWAVPLNTALLILLTIINYWHNRRTARRTDGVRKEVVDVKRHVGAVRRHDDRAEVMEIHEKESTPVDENTPTEQRRRFTD